MPPKKGNKASKKTIEKKKDKAIEDKTFGLKNKKKSKNVQAYIKQVSHQVKGTSDKKEREKLEQKKKKQQKDALDAQMKDLFKAAITQPKVPPGVDPKSIVCEFFKQNCCTKGNRCKFSHDLNVGKKAAKIDLYTDKRETDKIDEWDQNKLEEVIKEKHGVKRPNQTEIVCKYFLDAIENSQYGWFWVCPNGGKECKYRHALPPGYVFKTKAEREAERQNKVQEVSIEEIIEQQRAKLGSTGGTPVTEETLKQWKLDKAKRKAEALEIKRKEEVKKSGGRGLNVLSGRALFSYDPTLFRDDDEADDATYTVKPANEMDEEIEEKLPVPVVDEAAQAIDKSLYIKTDENLGQLLNEN